MIAYTFVILFHQSSKVMNIQILAVLLVIQSFIACQPAPDDIRVSAASIGFQSADSSKQDSERSLLPAANIVYQSVDNGQTWQDVSAGLPGDVQPESIFTGANEIFLGTQNGLYRSSNTSTTPIWRQSLFLYGRITAIFPGRTGLYACSYDHGLFHNITGTDIWMPLTNTLKDKTVRTVVETADGALFVGCDSGIFKSTDNGQTWKQVFEEGIVLNIVEMGGVLIGGSVNGVLRSTDGGEHWDYALNENILAKKTGLIGNQFVTILGTTDATKLIPEGVTHRLRASDDGGKTWHRLERALFPVQGVYDMDERLSQVKDLYDIIQAGEYLFCSFDTGIFRSSDQGKTWEPVFPTNGQVSFNFAVSGQVIYAVQKSAGC